MVILELIHEFGLMFATKRQHCLLALPVLLVLSISQNLVADDSLEQKIRQRTTQQPDDPVGWRLLGRLLLKRGDQCGALEAFERSVELDDASPAANFDLGSLLLDLDQAERAVLYLQRTVELAPDSEQAAEASAQLDSVQDEPQFASLVSFEAPWLDSPRAEGYALDQLKVGGSLNRFDWNMETGALFNSNVQLAPISRQLLRPELGAFQAYVAPEFEYRFLPDTDWQIGALFDGYFNVNEGHLRAFNLQHFQPGAYLDRAFIFGTTDLLLRVQYDYSLDLFDGATFGNRHAVTTSLNVNHQSPVTSIVYWTIDYTDFRDDGAVPSIDSVDGITNLVGASRSRNFDWQFLTQVAIGANFQWADLEGDDQAYRGVFVYADARLPFLFDSELVPTAGWGYRNFPDFTGTPSRNENLIVAGVKLERALTDCCTVTSFFSFEDFETKNELYKADRYRTGMFLSFGR